MAHEPCQARSLGVALGNDLEHPSPRPQNDRIPAIRDLAQFNLKYRSKLGNLPVVHGHPGTFGLDEDVRRHPRDVDDLLEQRGRHGRHQHGGVAVR